VLPSSVTAAKERLFATMMLPEKVTRSVHEQDA
jgi:hypothetical protein